MTLQKVLKPGGMTLQNFGHSLVLVAACACKCRGGMTLQKSAFRWRHEAANWQANFGASPAARRGQPIAPEQPGSLNDAPSLRHQ
jgi:hypothetical protein